MAVPQRPQTYRRQAQTPPVPRLRGHFWMRVSMACAAADRSGGDGLCQSANSIMIAHIERPTERPPDFWQAASDFGFLYASKISATPGSSMHG
jgi:hypothetical protein